MKRHGTRSTIPAQSAMTVHLLSGGEVDASWVEKPECPAIVIGTQDMLLSRALMRGYAMSRFQWPVHFAFLHADVFWVFDEVQLMGNGLATSAQLDAFRRNAPGFASAKAKSLWASATLNRQWLETVDFKPFASDLTEVAPTEEDRRQVPVEKRLRAKKRLTTADTVLSSDLLKKGAREYAEALAAEISRAHRPGANTLVVINMVQRAQAVFSSLDKMGLPCERMLLHARFRPHERNALQARLKQPPPVDGRIIVATQAVEAGVDISSAVMFTETAPWSSLVQRFGRCNRYGECDEADIRVVPIDSSKPGVETPYKLQDLLDAMAILKDLSSAAPCDLPPVTKAFRPSHVVRTKDFLELFNTDPDLFGFDVDVSVYVRDADAAQSQVFWRDFENDPGAQDKARREELCPASMSQIGAYLKKKGRAAYRWDPVSEAWRKADRPAPGAILLFKASDGGYDPLLGFCPDAKRKVQEVPKTETSPDESFGADFRSVRPAPVLLTDHLDNVAREVEALCEGLSSEHAAALAKAAKWHDVGKGHPVFRKTMTSCMQDPDDKKKAWAKSPCRARHERPYFRHELASALAWLSHCDGHPGADLVAYLIAAHHGKVRMSLRAVPGEKHPEDDTRCARGIREGDVLPELPAEGPVRVPETVLSLAPMEMGEGEHGSSWRSRAQRLLDTLGPFRLAFLESVLRVADWRASAREQERNNEDEP